MSDEAKRKLQVTGGSHGSYAITLPKKWVGNLKLRKGEYLFVTEEPDGRLSVYPPTLHSFSTVKSGMTAQFEVREGKSEIHSREEAHEAADMLIRKIVSAYLLGYDEIQIKGPLSENVRKELLNFAERRLLGLMPVASKFDLMRLKMFGHGLMSLEVALRDVRDSVLNMLNHVLELLGGTGYDRQTAGFIEYADQTIASYYFYIVRQLKAAVDNPRMRSELGLRHGRDLLGCRLMIKSIERISNHAAKIARLSKYIQWPILDVCGQECATAIKKGIERTMDVFVKALGAHPLLGKSDFESANLAIQEAKREIEKIGLLLNPEEEQVLIEHSNMRIIIESVGRTCEYASDIAEVVLNLTVDDLLAPGNSKMN